VVLAILLALGAAPGCGRSTGSQGGLEGTSEFQGMQNLGVMYRVMSDELKRPPKRIEELRRAEAQVPGGFSSLGEPNVAIYFGAAMSDTPDAKETVLAYDRLVPRQGGVVLMCDGSVRTMTPDEFRAAKKAGKTPWTAPPGS
jgi:hypothetical protein